MKSIEQNRSINQILPPFPGKDELATYLPGLVTASDVREVVRFLRRIPEGIPLVEVNEAFRKRILDSRKRSAYELWGIMIESEGRASLAELGWEFAARLAPETAVYREILTRTKPYLSALEWIHESELELVTCEEINQFWFDNHPKRVDGSLREGHVLTFFDLCHAGEIGRTTVGRKGHPARLRVYRDDLSAYLINIQRKGQSTNDTARLEAVPGFSTTQRVLVLQTRDVVLSTKLRAVLDLSRVESIFVEREEDLKNPISELALVAMRQCDSGVIVITQRDCSEDMNIREFLVVEIGAAFVHFNQRVVLLTQKGVRLPASFQNLRRCEFDGLVPSWKFLKQTIGTLETQTEE